MQKTRWGVIGCGWVSEFHLAGITWCESAELAGVCDRDEAAARRAAGQHGGTPVFTDYRDLLAVDDIDVVDVILPTHLHCETVCRAATAGKHVLCEKPLAPSVTECQEMMKAARDNDVLLMPMHNRVFYGPHIVAKGLLRDGAIGCPALFQANFLTDIGLRKGNFLSVNWRGLKSFSGGGVALESGVHLIYTAQDLLGRIAEVQATIIPSSNPAIDTEDGAVIAGRFARGGNLSLCLHRASSIIDDRQLIVGTEGAIRISAVEAIDVFAQPVLSVYRKSDATWRHPDAARDWETSFAKAIAHFTNCILGSERPTVTAEDGAGAIAVVEAVYESARTKRPVSPHSCRNV